MQGHKFSHPVRFLKLGGYDLVLGCDWLSNYNPIELDFHQLKVRFTQATRELILRALPLEPRAKMLSALSMAKLIRRRSVVTEGEFFLSHKTLNKVEENNKILELLLQFEDVFQEPNSLPPETNIEHCIELLPDAIPKKQHQYRYAYSQKTEIERIVKEMLNSGIIRPSHSSFVSPVLLVKKKDGLRYAPSAPQESHEIVEEAPALCKEEQMYLCIDEGHLEDSWDSRATTRSLLRDGVINKPLTLLLKKDAFEWNHEAEEAFNQLKKVMTTALALAMPNFSKPFTVETDASGTGIGAVLMQEGKPIAYLSKALAAKNLELSTYENEFFALLLAVTKWRHYLQGNHFIIRTDQKGLKYILDQRIDSVLQ
ncbi:UNVERIFIED_CONTAM: Retrovirus-related Pol polyprotein from transposon.6 [Sesamum angustifolium]|uniref:Retrovirus-related Pol polyprotein from transposon.6 n=1 Tax=Sesamum angustifolium TaxID=2727405 RepID=A0AAW2INV5_9LAMI